MAQYDAGMAAGLRSTAILYDAHLRLLAAHYSNMWTGRSNSAAFVADYFHELVAIAASDLFVEVGAHRAEASQRARATLPAARIVAFEANPYNFEEFSLSEPFNRLAIDYRHLAVTRQSGEVTFHLRTRSHGEGMDRVTGNSSLLPRVDPDTEYELISVPAVSLDDHFRDSAGRAALWMDVEGASRDVLLGAEDLLERTDLVLIEVEEKAMWEGQWRSLDIIEHFLARSFVPLTRDAEYNQQYNIIFVRDSFYERPEVLWSHELHLNYLTQHLGLHSTPDPAASFPARRAWFRSLRRPRRSNGGTG